jgi:hypothetical protein
VISNRMKEDEIEGMPQMQTVEKMMKTLMETLSALKSVVVVNAGELLKRRKTRIMSTFCIR